MTTQQQQQQQQQLAVQQAVAGVVGWASNLAWVILTSQTGPLGGRTLQLKPAL
jgi:hypothetical protein